MIAAEWRPVPGVRALCTSREGGVGMAPWNSFNLAGHVGDAPESVKQNRQELCHRAALPAEPRWLNQVHGHRVADLDDTVAATDAPADASVSCAAQICAVLTADCLPVLLAASDGSAVGAAHAGWRGLAAGVIDNTVTAMRQRLGSRVQLLAFLGPAISVAHFEVGDEVRDAFLAADAAASAAFHRNVHQRWQCDLYALARQRLAKLGIESIEGGDQCTYAQSNRYFSHRRDVQHQGLASTGRMANLIWRQA